MKKITKKSDLKNGMHVIVDGGREYLVINDVEADKQTWKANTIMVRLNGEGWLSLDNYHDDLCYYDDDNINDGYYDIKEVYVPLFYGNMLLSISDTNKFIKVWERSIVKKMTKEEIEAELGYKIEIID